jgi:hypothetical protein
MVKKPEAKPSKGAAAPKPAAKGAEKAGPKKTGKK